MVGLIQMERGTQGPAPLKATSFGMAKNPVIILLDLYIGP